MMTTETVTRPSAGIRHGRTLTVVVLVLAAACWAWLAQHDGQAHHLVEMVQVPDHGAQTLDHAAPGHESAPTLWPAQIGPARWYAGWLVMVVAMMLPPALPLLHVVRRLVASHPRPTLLVAVCAVAFIAAWAAVGVVLMLGAALLAGAAEQWAWLQAHPEVPSGLAAVVAGGYQLTPWKNACLTACRSPLGLAMTTWSGTRPGSFEAGLLGLRYGAVCVGCCWALMLLTLTVGTAALPVMVVAGVLMAAERMLAHVRPLIPMIAAAAVTTGLLLLAGVVPAGL